jgi:hypothetical protein
MRFGALLLVLEILAFAIVCPAGVVDESFRPKLPEDYGLSAVSEQSDGKLIVGGTKGAAGGESPLLIRLQKDGRLDKSFQVRWGKGENGYGGSIDQVQARPDGNIGALGSFTRIREGAAGSAALFGRHGAFRRSYQAEGAQAAIGWEPIKLLSDGGILYAQKIPDRWWTNHLVGQLCRLDANGKLIWQSQGIRPRSPGWGEAAWFAWCDELPDGTMVGGLVNPQGTYRGLWSWYYLYSSKWGLLKLDTTWRSTTAWTYNESGAGAVVVPGPTNTLYVGGAPHLGILTRRIEGWQIDPSFTFQSPETNGTIQALAVQHDGKLLFCFASGTTNRVYRCHADGTSDSSFSSGEDGASSVQRLLILRDGKALAWGSHYDANGIRRDTFLRLHTAESSIRDGE